YGQALSTSAGTTSAAGPTRRISPGSGGASGVAVFTLTIVAPERAARGTSPAAGQTRSAVPTTRRTSHPAAAAVAASIARSGSASPNQTTSGRRNAPQPGQRGGTEP